MGLFKPAEMAGFYATSQIEDAIYDDYNDTKYQINELCKYATIENIIDAIILKTNKLYNNKDKYLDICYSIFEFYNKNGYITNKQKMILCRYCVYHYIEVKI